MQNNAEKIWSLMELILILQKLSGICENPYKPS